VPDATGVNCNVLSKSGDVCLETINIPIV